MSRWTPRGLATALLALAALTRLASPAQGGTTTRVSVASDGTPGNRDSAAYGLSISADGRFVAFASDASNLVAGDANQSTGVSVHDRQTSETTRISVASAGTEGNALS